MTKIKINFTESMWEEFRKWKDFSQSEDFYSDSITYEYLSQMRKKEFIEFFVDFRKAGGMIQSGGGRRIETFKNTLTTQFPEFKKHVLEPFSEDFDVKKWMNDIEKFPQWGLGGATIYLVRINKDKYPVVNGGTETVLKNLGYTGLSNPITAYSVAKEVQKSIIETYPEIKNYYQADSLFRFIVENEYYQSIQRMDDEQQNASKNAFSLNQILYGPPGTGKTYNTVNKALEIILDKNDPLRELLSKDTPSEDDRLKIKEKYDEFVKAGQIRFVTFHQSYSYEDFIEGIRAETQNGQLSYSVKSGIFKQICEVAGKDQNKPYVLIIDEINRGNISRIFGELITLIEPSKREGAKETLTVQLPYSGDSFSVPKNIYLIGTMNTADRTLTRMDIALRRRFVFKEMPPKLDLLEDINVDGINIADMLSKINERIEVLLDKDQCIGHTYFLPLKDSSLDKLSEIFQENIIPLLQEYFFDDFERIRWVLNEDVKEEQYQFFKVGTAVGELFSDNARSKMPNKTSWKLNKDAFNKTESYKKIYE